MAGRFCDTVTPCFTALINFLLLGHRERMADTQNGMSFYTLPVSELTNYSENRLTFQRYIANRSFVQQFKSKESI
jgi:hypothetical protein